MSRLRNPIGSSPAGYRPVIRVSVADSRLNLEPFDLMQLAERPWCHWA